MSRKKNTYKYLGIIKKLEPENQKNMDTRRNRNKEEEKEETSYMKRKWTYIIKEWMIVLKLESQKFMKTVY